MKDKIIKKCIKPNAGLYQAQGPSENLDKQL